MKLRIHARLDYSVPRPTDILLQIEAASMADQSIADARLDLSNASEGTRVSGEDGIGTRLWLHVPERFVAEYSAEVTVSRAAPALETRAAVPPCELPAEIVPYLMDSRYCPANDFQVYVADTFGALEGGAKIAAMADHVRNTIRYTIGSSNSDTTAADTFVRREGICRDFAHVLVTLARAAAIPARVTSVYAPRVDPPDFHAVAQVFLEGDWHLVDPTGMALPDEMAVIGVGRDAADIAFLSAFGQVDFIGQSVSVRAA